MILVCGGPMSLCGIRDITMEFWFFGGLVLFLWVWARVSVVHAAQKSPIKTELYTCWILLILGTGNFTPMAKQDPWGQVLNDYCTGYLCIIHGGERSALIPHPLPSGGGDLGRSSVKYGWMNYKICATVMLLLSSQFLSSSLLTS